MKDERLKKELNDKMTVIETEGLKLADHVYQYVEDQLCC